MIENPETGALENFDFDHLLRHVPELKRFNYHICSYQFDPPIDSSDMEPLMWAKIVEIIHYNYERFDGFVILHGTDTMAYTASALSFMLENLGKPVILTGLATAHRHPAHGRQGEPHHRHRNCRRPPSRRFAHGTRSLHLLRKRTDAGNRTTKINAEISTPSAPSIIPRWPKQASTSATTSTSSVAPTPPVR